MKSFLIVLISIILFSCENDWGKYGGYKMEYDSALEYYIALDKIDTVLKDYKYFNKGAFIRYYKNSGSIDTVFVGNEGQVIESYINSDNVSFDTTFILIAQKPLDQICECNDSCLSKKYLNTNELPTYNMCKEALEKSTFFQYWIINKKSNAIYGPLNKNEYKQKRKELGVPIKLEIKSLLLP